MKGKKSLLRICILVAVLLLTTVLFACNGTTNTTDSESENKDNKGTEEHVHSDACWQRGTSVRGNCITYGYTDYQCVVTGEVRREYEKTYGMHDYVGHVCRLCGAREDASESWSSGSTTVYLYTVFVDITEAGNSTYWLVVEGDGATASYSRIGSRPWEEYLTHIVRFQTTNGVTELGENFLAGATALNELMIGSGLRVIGKNAFSGCTSLENAALESTGISTVKEGAFASCTSLANCALPVSCTKIGQGAFYRCNALRSLTIPKVGSSGTNTESRFFGSIFSDNVGEEEGATQVVTYEGETYGFVVPSRLYDLTLTGDFDVNAYAFCGESTIRTVTFTGSIKVIERYGMAKMESLCDVTFSKSTLTTIEDYAFQEDIKLGSKERELDENGETVETTRILVLPPSLTSIGEGAFFSCSEMEHIELGKTQLTEIPKDAFNGCSALETVIIPETIRLIALNAFQSAGLNEIRIPASVKTILSGAFVGCAKLDHVYIDSEDVYHTPKNDNSGLFDSAQRVYVLDEAVDDDPKQADGSYIKKYFTKYRGIGEDTNGYHLWMR